MNCVLAISLFIVFQLLEVTSAQYEDIRCKCTCLAYNKYNIPAKIYTKNVLHEYCNCLMVVLPNLNGSNLTDVDIEPYCLRCGCKYEVRSTKTMQVVVYLFLVLLGVLLIYMVVMVIADPFINYVNKRNRAAGLLEDETEMDCIPPAERTRTSSRLSSTGQSKSSVLQKVNQVQTKWKRQLKEQKSSVYERQEMLQ
uniref:Transmembrane protein 9 n=1 Tax=Ciona savignyi TaxID=51511 RepID=H2YKA3_CIOSA